MYLLVSERNIRLEFIRRRNNVEQQGGKRRGEIC